MKRYIARAEGNRLGLFPGVAFKVDVDALSERDREKHACDLRLNRITWHPERD